MARRALALTVTVAAASAADPRFPPVQLWLCSGGAPNQTWSLNATGQPAGATRILQRSLAWDLNGPLNATGTAVHLVRPLNSASQTWRWDAPHGRWSSDFAPGKCAVPVAAFSGAPLQLAPCGESKLEAFAYDAAAGTFTLAADPTLCVDGGTVAGSCAAPPTSALPFCDAALGPGARAADLASRLTVAELGLLLSNKNVGVPRFSIASIGYGEALHGYNRPCLATPVAGSSGCPTSFPHLHLIGGSFNRSLWHAVAAAIADEGRAYFNLDNRSSHLITWAPDINPFRDPRWGRGQEVASEDPVHLSEFIYEYARGLQEGEDEAHYKLISTAKHFSGYDLENNTDPTGAYWYRMNFTAVITRKDAAQFYWPPFLSAVQRGRVASIMCSYNSVCLDCDPTMLNGTGVPSCADDALQNGMLRGAWGFDGFIVSDCDAIREITGGHHYAATGLGGAVDGINGGTDVDCTF